MYFWKTYLSTFELPTLRVGPSANRLTVYSETLLVVSVVHNHLASLRWFPGFGRQQAFLEKSNTGVVVKHWQKEQRLSVKRHISKPIMSQNDTPGACMFMNSYSSVKKYRCSAINDGRILCLGGALCPTSVFKKVQLKKTCFFWKTWFL